MDLEDIKNSSDADSQEKQISDIDTKTEQKIDSQKSKQILPKNDKDKNIDRRFYEEILEKLDIKPKDKMQPNSENTESESGSGKEEYLKQIKNLEKIQAKNKLEKTLSQDFSKIQQLVKNNLISSEQGQNLKKQVLKKAFDRLVQTEKVKRFLPSESKLNNNVNINNGFEEFSKSNPEFFSPEGRKEVLNYLKSAKVSVGKDELNKISDVIRLVEKAAIERYLQKEAHEMNLKNSNESAKQRLTANAQKSNFNASMSRTFTREQIGKMSGAEFAKYESAIMEALKKGLIK